MKYAWTFSALLGVAALTGAVVATKPDVFGDGVALADSHVTPKAPEVKIAAEQIEAIVRALKEETERPQRSKSWRALVQQKMFDGAWDTKKSESSLILTQGLNDYTRTMNGFDIQMRLMHSFICKMWEVVPILVLQGGLRFSSPVATQVKTIFAILALLTGQAEARNAASDVTGEWPEKKKEDAPPAFIPRQLEKWLEVPRGQRKLEELAIREMLKAPVDRKVLADILAKANVDSSMQIADPELFEHLTIFGWERMQGDDFFRSQVARQPKPTFPTRAVVANLMADVFSAYTIFMVAVDAPLLLVLLGFNILFMMVDCLTAYKHLDWADSPVGKMYARSTYRGPGRRIVDVTDDSELIDELQDDQTTTGISRPASDLRGRSTHRM